MKLSDLVKMAKGADPEILIVQATQREWEAFPLDARPNPLLGFKDEVLTIAALPVLPVLRGNFKRPKPLTKKQKEEIKQDFLSWQGMDTYPNDENECIVYAENAAPAKYDTDLVLEFLKEWMHDAQSKA